MVNRDAIGVTIQDLGCVIPRSSAWQRPVIPRSSETQRPGMWGRAMGGQINDEASRGQHNTLCFRSRTDYEDVLMDYEDARSQEVLSGVTKMPGVRSYEDASLS